MKTKMLFIIAMLLFCIYNTSNAQTDSKEEMSQKITQLKEKIQQLTEEKTLLEFSLANKELGKYQATALLFFSCKNCNYDKVCFGINDSLAYVKVVITDMNKKNIKTIGYKKGEFINLSNIDESFHIELFTPDGINMSIGKQFEL